MGVEPLGPEPGEHVTRAQTGELAERSQTQPDEEVDQFRRDLAQLTQPGDRALLEEVGRTAGWDHQHTRWCTGCTSSGDRRSRPSVGHTDPRIGPGGQTNDLDHPLGHGLVTPEVTRGPTGRQADQPGLDDLEFGCHVGDRANDWLERTGVTVGIVVEHQKLGAGTLRRTPTLSLLHPSGHGCRRPGDHTVGVEHRRRLPGRNPCREDRPVRAPHGDQPGDIVDDHRRSSAGAAEYLERPTGTISIGTISVGMCPREFVMLIEFVITVFLPTGTFHDCKTTCGTRQPEFPLDLAWHTPPTDAHHGTPTHQRAVPLAEPRPFDRRRGELDIAGHTWRDRTHREQHDTT